MQVSDQVLKFVDHAPHGGLSSKVGDVAGRGLPFGGLKAGLEGGEVVEGNFELNGIVNDLNGLLTASAERGAENFMPLNKGMYAIPQNPH